jgi:hypothetical protein
MNMGINPQVNTSAWARDGFTIQGVAVSIARTVNWASHHKADMAIPPAAAKNPKRCGASSIRANLHGAEAADVLVSGVDAFAQDVGEGGAEMGLSGMYLAATGKACWTYAQITWRYWAGL